MDASKLITMEIFSQLEKKWLMEWENRSSCSPYSKPKTARILCIDGAAAVRGLVAGEALIHLEDCIRSATSNPDASITDFFDLVAGTGIGGVLAAFLTASGPSGRPLFSARAAVDYLRSNHRRLFRPAGVLRRRLSGRSFEAVLREALPGLTLKDTCKPLLIPCYDLNTSAPFVFSRAGATESPSLDFELWRVCRATSATPGLFKPCRLASVDGKTACTAIDGGLVMNNPSAAAVTHVLHNKLDFPAVAGVEDLLVLSLGNGSPSPRGRSGTGLVEIVLDGVSETVDQILSNAFSWCPMDYVRIEANGLATAGEKGEGAAAAARRAGQRMLRECSTVSLPFGGKRALAESNAERIDGLVHRLAAVATVDVPLRPAKETATVTNLADSR